LDIGETTIYAHYIVHPAIYPPEVQHLPLLDEFMGSTMKGQKPFTVTILAWPPSSQYQHQTHETIPSGQPSQLNP